MEAREGTRDTAWVAWLCEALRSRAETRHVPVLMMTSLDDDASIIKAY